MRDLERALTDISAMRSQIARGTEFRGYGPAAFAATGVLAIGASLAQAQWIDDPAGHVLAYLALWIITALVSAVVIGIDVATRSRRVHSGLADEMIQTAVEQLLPAVVAGALLTVVLVRFAPASAWLLPGLWQLILSLGVFASCRALPALLTVVALWYLSTGLACMAYASGEYAFSPWAMGVPFGAGQLLAAVLIRKVGGGDVEA